MLSPQPRRPPAQSAGNVGPELGTSRQSLPPYPNVARLEPCTEGRAPSIRYPDVDRAIESSPRCSRIDPFLAVVLPFEANTHRNRGDGLGTRAVPAPDCGSSASTARWLFPNQQIRSCVLLCAGWGSDQAAAQNPSASLRHFGCPEKINCRTGGVVAVCTTFTKQ